MQPQADAINLTIVSLKDELPLCFAKPKPMDINTCTEWWKLSLLCWFATAKKVLLLQLFYTFAEQVLSLLNKSFSS